MSSATSLACALWIGGFRNPGWWEWVPWIGGSEEDPGRWIGGSWDPGLEPAKTKAAGIGGPGPGASCNVEGGGTAWNKTGAREMC